MFWLTTKTWRPARLSASSVEPVFAARMTAEERRKRRQNLALLCSQHIPHQPLPEDPSPAAPPAIRRKSQSLQLSSNLAPEPRRASTLSVSSRRNSQAPVPQIQLPRRPFLRRVRNALTSFFRRFRSGHERLPPPSHDTSDASVQADELSIIASSPARKPKSDKEQVLFRVKHVGVPVLPPSWEVFTPTNPPPKLVPPPDLVNASLLMERKRIISGYEKRRVSFSEPLETVYHVDSPPFEKCKPGETVVPQAENRPLILFL